MIHQAKIIHWAALGWSSTLCFRYILTQLGKTQLLQIANIIYNNWQYLPILLALETLEERGVKLSIHHHCAASLWLPSQSLILKPLILLFMGNS